MGNVNYWRKQKTTHEVEKRGSRFFYFHSTNCEGFKNSKGYNPPFIVWKTATLNSIIVWDCGQQNFINRSRDKKVTTYIVEPNWFKSGLEYLPNLLPNSVAVFGVQPVRDAFYNTLGITFDYYIPRYCNKFLNDIHDLLQDTETTMILKRMRNIGKLIHP